MLSKQPLWHSLLSHFKLHEVLVEGPLNNLKQSMVAFARPKRPWQSLATPVFTPAQVWPGRHAGVGFAWAWARVGVGVRLG